MREFTRAFLSRPAGVVGLVLIGLICLLAIVAPLLYPASPWDMAGIPFSAPGENGMLLGSDTLGRDIAAGIVHGARVSILIGLASTLTALCIGVLLGCIAGYAGGVTDTIIVRFTEVFQTIPSFVLAILFVAILTPSIYTIILAIGLVSWPPLSRLTRAQVKTISQREFVQAARCQGQSTLSVVVRHVLPNAVSPIIVAGSLTVAAAILIEAALSFMGLGDPNLMSWGYMIGAGRTVIRQAWWMSVFPGIAILLTVVAINLAGEALNDTLNPRISRA
ncbi:ABC transporter permease [Aquamicrobium sp. NLF2-7]|jgi:peptide/nickel transport system permease protein|uniref:ABC transporter permease n=1 Tax=Aquamicrobium TaxID=69278 RepID=UPI001EFB0A8E|nr:MULTISPECIES: ABC transporter permease [Aquamicrobium]MCG8274330.1 ABC transporter permease [Aquamicrobium sp. NLF2-7]MDH4989824.1 ABC transporter permease [Aquamicrobium lusatiense]